LRVQTTAPLVLFAHCGSAGAAFRHARKQA
jgi:hypothetical protein